MVDKPRPDPFATGGGGTLFEYKAAAWFAKDILTGRDTTLGGRVTALRLQPADVGGFDDFRIELETSSNEVIRIDAQARYQQRLTANNEKFKKLMAAAMAEIPADRESFEAGRKRLLLVVSQRSPGHVSLRDLCRAASNASSIATFNERVSAHAPLRSRLEQIELALGEPSAEDAYALLSALDVVALDFDGSLSDCCVRSTNELAELWTPPSAADGRDSFLRLFWELIDRGPQGETVDEASLRKVLGPGVPPSRLGASRRGRLHAICEASHGRVVGQLVALGLAEEEAGRMADYALSIPAEVTDERLSVITGGIGVGKSTEVERILRESAIHALDAPTSLMPVRIEASEVKVRPLRELLIDRAIGLGRPEVNGVAVFIDGLDEVGMSVEEMLPPVYAILNEWPLSKFVLGTRDPGRDHAVPTRHVQPLKDKPHGRIVELLGVDSRILLGTRSEVSEMLQRPLFAILHALQWRSGQRQTTSAAELTNALAEHAVRRAGTNILQVSARLAELAGKLVDLGGAARPQDVGLSVIELDELGRSRLLDTSDGLVRFQLALLLEWFAARHLFLAPAFAASVVQDPTRAVRWREVMARAVAQASEEQADDLLATLCQNNAVALVAGILRDTVAMFTAEASGTVTSTRAAERVRHALSTLAAATAPTSRSLRGLDQAGNPIVGVRAEGIRLELALPSMNESQERMAERSYFPPQPSTYFKPSQPGTTWLPYWVGGRPSGPAWPWLWPLEDCAAQIEQLLLSGAMAANIGPFQAELAWRCAHTMLDREATIQRSPIAVDELEAIVSRWETEYPNVPDLTIRHGNKTWRRSEGRRFVNDLHSQGPGEVASPWPTADRTSGWVSGFWSGPQLLSRLTGVGQAVLDGYQAMVDRWLPAFAQFLPIYRLLPATIRGFVLVPEGDHGIGNATEFVWYIEPSETASNSAHWELVEDRSQFPGESHFDDALARLRALRSDTPYQWFPVHYGEPDIFTPAPASRLARSLLHGELRDLDWCKKNLPSSFDDPVACPRLDG